MISLLVSPVALSLGCWDEDDDRLHIAAKITPILSATDARIAAGRSAQQLGGARRVIRCEALLSILDGRDKPLSSEWRFDATTLFSGMLSKLKADAEMNGLPKSAALAIILPDGTGPSLERSVRVAASVAGFRPLVVRYVAGCVAAKSDVSKHVVISFDNLALTATLFGSDPLDPIGVLHRSELGSDSIVAAVERRLSARLSAIGIGNSGLQKHERLQKNDRLRQAAAMLVAELDNEPSIASTIVDYQGRCLELHLTAAELEAELSPHIVAFERELGDLKRLHNFPAVAPTIYSEMQQLPPWLTCLATRTNAGLPPKIVTAKHAMEGCFALGAERTADQDNDGGNMIGLVISGSGRPRFDLLFDLANASHMKVVRNFSFKGLARLELVRSSADGESYISLGTLTYPEYTMLGWPIQFEFVLHDGGTISIVGSDDKSRVTARRSVRIDGDQLGNDGALDHLTRSVSRLRFVQASL